MCGGQVWPCRLDDARLCGKSGSLLLPEEVGGEYNVGLAAGSVAFHAESSMGTSHDPPNQ